VDDEGSVMTFVRNGEFDNRVLVRDGFPEESLRYGRRQQNSFHRHVAAHRHVDGHAEALGLRILKFLSIHRFLCPGA